MQSPVGWHCCILHSVEHIQQIRGVTNPFLTARTFQRVSVPVNNTSSGFHTSELMRLAHSHVQIKSEVCDFEDGDRESRRACPRISTGVRARLQAHVRFCVMRLSLNGVFSVVNQKRGCGECQAGAGEESSSPLSFCVDTS